MRSSVKFISDKLLYNCAITTLHTSMCICMCVRVKAAAMIGSIETIEWRNGMENNILAAKPQLEVINMQRSHWHKPTHKHYAALMPH